MKDNLMIKNVFKLLGVYIFLTMSGSLVFGHCQIPCGIYDDHAQIEEMIQDVHTIQKAVHMISDLSVEEDAQSKNQITRWVVNKENHAQNIISNISDYFLTQRVKPTQADYAERLMKHHAVIIASMKAKQSVDADIVASLMDAVEAIAVYYPEGDH